MEEAILKNDIEKVRYLLEEEGIDPNSRTELGTPLIFLSENLEILKILLDNGADPNNTDENGFMLQDYSDNDEILSLLKAPRKPNPTILSTNSKLAKYNETFKLRSRKTKTFKAKRKSHQVVPAI